jgi:hypothetical protein
MDKVTKAFVIAACSVVIAVGGVWLEGSYKRSRAFQDCVQKTTRNNSLDGTVSQGVHEMLIHCSEQIQFVRN